MKSNKTFIILGSLVHKISQLEFILFCKPIKTAIIRLIALYRYYKEIELVLQHILLVYLHIPMSLNRMPDVKLKNLYCQANTINLDWAFH
jgi:hypothetical protein